MTESAKQETCTLEFHGKVCGQPADEVIVPGVYAVCRVHAVKLNKARSMSRLESRAK